MQAVTSVYWSSSWAEPPLLYVQRKEASGLYSVLTMTSLFKEGSEISTVIDGILDFQVKGDFAFATRDVNGKGITLLVSYQGSPFEEAHFDRITSKHIGYYIADVSGSDILVAVNHENDLPTLYFSRENNGKIFSLSMRNFACYFPGKLWNNSIFRGATHTVFADLHKVDGLRGIYIASQIQTMNNFKLNLTNISTEHLSTLITFNKGKQWQLLNVSTSEAEGNGDSCSKDSTCSLHLTQKFAGFLLGSQIMPPVTSKFAPGVIIATGTLGLSQKGAYSLFISTDAGITWRLALRGHYLYQMGDYGGAIVAMKYDKKTGTKDLLYSIDSGHNWLSQPFFDRDLQVVNMLAEVGGKSTVFTALGTENYGNYWLVIKIDLREAFSKNCSEMDYEFWSPSTEYTGSTSCVMGEKEVHERRKPQSSCYTSYEYLRTARKELCDCSLEDFECDVGFFKHKYSLDCVRDKRLDSPYGAPNNCMPGDFYNRTKGYRIVPEDVCNRSSAERYLPDVLPCPDREIPEILIASDRNGINRRYIATNNWEMLPRKNLTNPIALEVDVHNSCVYWTDTAHTIERQCMNGVHISFDTLVNTGKSIVEGLALDWVSHLLYFVEATNANIKVISTEENSGKNVQSATILSKPVLEKPRGIAVHPREGLLFWTDWGIKSPSVSRASADGSNVRQLFGKPDVGFPNGLAIDFIGERIYWVDARLDYMASADLDGLAFRKVITDSEYLRHPFAIAVFKDHVYWSDWMTRMIYQADKDNGENIQPFSEKLDGLNPIKIFAHSLQEGTNACADVNKTKCSHFCIGLPRHSYTCKCPDYFYLDANNICVPICGEKFRCANSSECIASSKRCDGFKDCSDNSDEEDCQKYLCADDEIKCKSGNTCIPVSQWCNGAFDCPDQSDEQNCTTLTTTAPAITTRVPCHSRFFLCDNGKHCIPRTWRCDGDEDCFDGSDEKGCTVMSTEKLHKCSVGEEFSCEKNSECIPSSKQCDGFMDCSDGSDEQDCLKEPCAAHEIECETGNICIPASRWCDGHADCPDESDEQKCAPPTTTPAATTRISCSSGFFPCVDGDSCIPHWKRCDKFEDCGDGSDEKGCTDNTAKKSHRALFRCSMGMNIPTRLVCDGKVDCPAGEDEMDCADKRVSCSPEEFRCHRDGSCLPRELVCDGQPQCSDRSDENSCPEQHSTQHRSDGKKSYQLSPSEASGANQ